MPPPIAKVGSNQLVARPREAWGHQASSFSKTVWKGLAVAIVLAGTMMQTVEAREGRRKVFEQELPPKSTSMLAWMEQPVTESYLGMLYLACLTASLVVFYVRICNDMRRTWNGEISLDDGLDSEDEDDQGGIPNGVPDEENQIEEVARVQNRRIVLKVPIPRPCDGCPPRN